MSVYQIVFSPTGGTRKVASSLASAFGESAYVDLCAQRYDFSHVALQAEDVCIVAVPSFGGRIPPLAAQRLSTLSGNGSRAVLAAVYGNRHIDDTLIELSDLLLSRGFRPAAAVSAVAEHSIVRRFAEGRPDFDDREQLEGFSAKIKEALSQDKGDYALSVPGNRPYKETKPSSAKPETSSACVFCGACAERCPAGAIPADAPNVTELDRCISCMRCIAVCPVHARSLPAKMVDALAARLEPVCSQPKENRLYLSSPV